MVDHKGGARMGLFDFLKGKSLKGKTKQKSSNTIDQYSNIKTLHIESMMYYQKARELYERNEVFFPTLQESVRFQLLNHQKNGFDRVEILAAESQSCNVCQKMNDNVLTITTALKNMPIPRKDCKHSPNENGEGWCRCTYVPYVDDL
ncbi:hypothetical protein [Methanococcoides sp. NM1]|uniref:hypothetical protein n=1 Tax=Methanococcoides sp. NM1 TaxID=1201013 RepID=UPI00108243DD|nr:hypothetical protein [Methanococcoides sp. NM1]